MAKKSRKPEPHDQASVGKSTIPFASPNKPIPAALKDLIDSCLVPILVKRFMAEHQTTKEDEVA